MSRTDLWRRSATRVEVDQRSREARLQLEHAERLVALPTRSWLMVVLYCFGFRMSGGGRLSS